MEIKVKAGASAVLGSVCIPCLTSVHGADFALVEFLLKSQVLQPKIGLGLIQRITFEDKLSAVNISDLL